MADRERDVRAVLYRRAEVVTLGPGLPSATALATMGDRIAHVGTETACRAALQTIGATDVVDVDLDGRCVLPGFIDTHLHPIGMLYYDMNADLRGVDSIAALQETLRRAASGLAAGEWLVGLQLEDEALAERRLPTAAELDAACPDRPVVVMEHDGHSGIGNTVALAAAGINAHGVDPPGGRIARDARGTPTGPCFESAAQRLFGAVPSPSLERLGTTAAASFGRLAACGITSAGVVLQTDEEGPGGEAGRLESVAMQLLLRQACFATYAILIGRSVDAAIAARDSALHDPAAGRRVGGFKIFADGTFGSCTAHVRAPFADRPGEHGMATLTQEEILTRMRAAHAAGLQICVHAIGDRAIEDCVALYERLLREAPRRAHRHRIEHASLLPPDLIAHLARLGICVSTQPLFIHSEKGWLDRRLGERAHHAYPLRALIDAGIVVGGASDAPVESTNVLHAIQCCVTREGFHPEHALTPAEAVHLFTRDAAFIQFEEAEKGTLAVGKRADFVVLSDNPLAVAAERIASISVLRTVCGGRTTYDAEGTR